MNSFQMIPPAPKKGMTAKEELSQSSAADNLKAYVH